MNACDVFCLPSHNEGCPNVVLEALACGASIVATKVGGIPELIESEEQGLLVPPGKPHELAKAIEKSFAGLNNSNRKVPEIQSWAENARKVFDVLTSATKL
jgi:glycosyltransferase involved in cell wall biosynthesis